MYLKALTIKGFKSFADPATLQFEPGLTVVVGPNGSGKSNVVDAVAWVLGAQGPRTVRSAKMEDVIFAGSADRPALGRAEVSLTIDNRAGRLPGGLAEITLTRILFRSGDSEYAINGQTCRLLDVQELLSDSGVGRQQHVIIGQGQLDHVLNARPEDRRSIIEEAAGVLKHRRRRERAERRLAAAEENLERLGDLVREVRRQIRPLERQAEAARSHAALAAERQALRLHLLGRELVALDERRRAAGAEADALGAEQQRLTATAADLEAAADTAAAELSARRHEDLVAVLTRVQRLAERSRGLAAVLDERRRSLRRDLDAAADVDVVSTLEAEGARLAGELQAAADAAERLGPDTAQLQEAEQRLATDVAAHDRAFGDVGGLRSAEQQYAAAKGRVEPLRRALQRDQVNLQRLQQRAEAAERRLGELGRESEELQAELAELQAAAPQQQDDATTRRHGAQRAAEELAAAEQAARAAEGERHRLEARAEALAAAAAAARGAAGADALADVDGVVGILADLVQVDEGWRPAVEAAAGAALTAMVVEGTESARRALARLAERDAPGAVLALAHGPEARVERAVPAGTAPVRPHVRPRAEGPAAGVVAGVLDRLLGDAVAVDGDWRHALDVADAHPDLVVVSGHGDRFGRFGWRVRAGDEQVTAAAVDEAAAAAAAAARRAEQAAAGLAAARRRAEEARSEAAEASRRAERGGDRLQALRGTQRRLHQQLAAAQAEESDARRQRDELAERVTNDRAVLADLEANLPGLRQAAEDAAGRLRQVSEARRTLEQRRAQLATRRRQLEVQAASLAERRRVLGERLQDVERRLAGHAAERQQAAVRRQRLEADLAVVQRLATVVERHRQRLDPTAEQLRRQRDRQLDQARRGGERLEELRRRRAEVERRTSQVRERLQRLQLDLAEAAVRDEALVEVLERELGADADAARQAPQPELPEGTTAAQRAHAVDEQLAALGPVNPLALQELTELQQRHGFLQEQVEDVRRARRELQQVIAAVDDEITRVFAEAFADVNEHFQNLVATLFPGGTGRLTLTDPANILDTGVEVEARPAGKNVRRLTLLSGGERSLVALAFLFAVFRSRPSPFYLMDEVEAALDDVNLHRFLSLLHQFRLEAQLIIVSHQKRTMETADALYGVTMQPGGSSKVVSQKVRRDPDAAASASAP